jgi:hypothetical protein
MRRSIHLFFRLCIGVFLAACSIQQAVQEHKEQQARMTRSLDGYVGKSIADVNAERGPPTSTLELAANRRSFQWEMTTETSERAAAAPGSQMAVILPKGEQTCLVTIVASTAAPSPALSDWIVESTQWKGANC